MPARRLVCIREFRRSLLLLAQWVLCNEGALCLHTATLLQTLLTTANESRLCNNFALAIARLEEGTGKAKEPKQPHLRVESA